MLELFVIYEKPADYLGRFVVRQWFCSAPLRAAVKPLIVAESLDAARHALPAGLVNIGRECCDDPCIVEVWV